jgi:peptidylprolyl isomerase/peptidyl-prolyl cis-trans isomerase A (cyclophilin A)
MIRPLVVPAAVAALLVMSIPQSACAQTQKPGGEKATFAVFETSRGKIGVRLLPQKAPKAVDTFVGLATGKRSWTDPSTGQKSSQPLYDGTIFHRVIPGFMIQGGDPLSRGAQVGQTAAPNGRPFGTGDPGFRFDDELDRAGAKPFATPCQLAMANSGPNTNGSQFFITEVKTPHLDPRSCAEGKNGVCGYVHFGEGVCGCDLVSQIARGGNGQTRLVKVTITSEPPTCK